MVIKSALAVICLSIGAALAAAPITIDSNPINGISAGRNLLLLEDREGLLKAEDLAGLAESDFFRSKENVPNFSFTQSAFWGRLDFVNNLPQDVPLILEYAYPAADFVDFYSYTAEGTWKKWEGGDRRQASMRSIRHRMVAFPIDIKSGSSTILIRVQTQGVNQLPITLWSPPQFHDHRMYETGFLMLLLGILAVMILYNLFVAIMTKSPVLYIYVAYLMSATSMFVSGQTGLIGLTLFDEFSEFIMNHGYLLVASCSAFFASLLCYRFLEITRAFKFSHFSLFAVMGFCVVSLFVSLINYNLGTKLVTLANLICILLIFTISISRSIQRFRPAYFFAIAWFLVIMGTLVYILTLAGVLASHPISIFAPSLGLVFEVFLISLAIGDKMRRQIQTALEENNRINAELIKQDHARTAFFHNTSHELRTPLNGIIGFLDLLQKGRYGQPTEAMHSQLAKVHRLAISLKNQVNLILDLAKSSRGELELNNARIDLNEFIREVKNLATGLQLKHKNSSFFIHANWNLDTENPNFIHDREQLLSVVRNLVGNAFKFAPFDSLNTVSLDFNLDAKKDSLELKVSDQGIGIPIDQQELIFNEFKQIQDDAKRAYEGSGLGLALVKKIIMLSGGKVTIESTEGKGSLFRLSIPAQSLPAAALHTQNVVKPIKQLQPSLDSKLDLSRNTESRKFKEVSIELPTEFLPSTKTILVVDDNEVNCEVIQDILSHYGYRIHTAGGGQACLEYLRHHRPDLILLDLMMPEVSGEDVLKKMKQDSILAEIPVILVTARASEEDRIEGLRLGADDYLAKPIIAMELTLRVHNLLSRIELTRITEHFEGREKMAFMGELLTVLSHEIKNVNASVLGDQKQSLKKIDLLWSSLGLPATADFHSISRAAIHDNLQARHDHLQIPAQQYESKRPLEMLKIILGSSALDLNQLDQVWAEILSLNPRQILLTEAVMSLSANVVRMTDSAKRTYELITTILCYGREPAADEQCKLAEAIQEALELLAFRIQKAGIRLDLDIPDHIVVKISRIDLGQIVLNLVHNAINGYSQDRAGQSIKAIKISHEEDLDSCIHLLIQSYDQVIPIELRHRIFERSFNSNAGKDAGNGLYISKRIAQRIQTDLELRENCDHTCFDLRLKKAS